MKYALLFALLLTPFMAIPAFADDPSAKFFDGPWNTTKPIKLDGTMRAATVNRGEKWKARFGGVWQGQPFEYVVEFTGTPDNLTGSARIDGADYTWKGKIEDDVFSGTFTGTRYTGSFRLKRYTPKE
jgi:hypothetical protein